MDIGTIITIVSLAGTFLAAFGAFVFWFGGKITAFDLSVTNLTKAINGMPGDVLVLKTKQEEIIKDVAQHSKNWEKIDEWKSHIEFAVGRVQKKPRVHRRQPG